MAKKYYSEPGMAGIKLLITAMRRNIERVESRYRNHQTRETCRALAAACDVMWQALEEDRPFTVYVGKQLSLEFVFGDREVEIIPFSEPYETPPINHDEAEDFWARGTDPLVDYGTDDDAYSQVD